MNTKCDSSGDIVGSVEVPYYDTESSNLSDTSLLFRGYLCEARTIHTIAAYGRQVM